MIFRVKLGAPTPTERAAVTREQGDLPDRRRPAGATPTRRSLLRPFLSPAKQVVSRRPRARRALLRHQLWCGPPENNLNCARAEHGDISDTATGLAPAYSPAPNRDEPKMTRRPAALRTNATSRRLGSGAMEPLGARRMMSSTFYGRNSIGAWLESSSKALVPFPPRRGVALELGLHRLIGVADDRPAGGRRPGDTADLG